MRVNGLTELMEVSNKIKIIMTNRIDFKFIFICQTIKQTDAIGEEPRQAPSRITILAKRREVFALPHSGKVERLIFPI